MRKKIIFGLICLFAFATGVNAEEYSDFFKEMVPNGVLDMSDSIAPTTEAESEFYMAAHFYKLYKDEPVYGVLNECNEDKSECEFSLYYEVDGEGIHEAHRVQIKWHETDPKVKSIIDSYVKELEKTRPESLEEDWLSIINFDVTDLNLVNYFSHITDAESVYDMNSVANYSKDLKEKFGNSNITYYLDMRAGDAEPFKSFGFGGFTLSYEGVTYGFVDQVGINQTRVIYIPEETENTKEAYIAAAKARIDEYLGNNGVKIEVAGLRADYYDGEVDYSKFGDESKMGDYYYNVTIGDVVETFIIMRDSSKIEKPKYETKDMATDIIISSTSSEVPLDTNIKVEIIKEETEKFKEIVETLKVETAQVYDLKLYSDSGSKFVSKLSSGEFEVSVPIAENLKGKNLIAYYVNENKEVIEHPVTIVGDYAKFMTTHFSIYTIAEKETKVEEDVLDEQVPPTFDGIISYVVLGCVGLVGLGATGIIIKKREN